MFVRDSDEDMSEYLYSLTLLFSHFLSVAGTGVVLEMHLEVAHQQRYQ